MRTSNSFSVWCGMALSAVVLLGSVPSSATWSSAPRHMVFADFNGDGFADLAALSSGGVRVRYGGPTGLTAAGNQFVKGIFAPLGLRRGTRCGGL